MQAKGKRCFGLERLVDVLDDALVSRDTDAADGTMRLALVVNASNRDRVVAWLTSRLPGAGVTFADRTRETAMIAVQGPLAIQIVGSLCTPADAARIAGLGNYRATSAVVAGHAAAVSRWAGQGSVIDRLTDPRGYTGASKHRFDADGRGRGLDGRDGGGGLSQAMSAVPESGAPFLQDAPQGYGAGKVGSSRLHE